MHNDSLLNKTIVITGASRGIGAAIAHTLASAGASLVLMARNIEQLNCLAEELRQSFKIEILTILLDNNDTLSIKNAFQEVFKKFGAIFGLVNNAGILKSSLLGMMTETELQEMFATNVNGLIFCTQYAVKLMQRQKIGSIVNISSIFGTNGCIGHVGYSASKAAVIGITKTLSKELASSNIRVNAVAPGFINTDMTKSLSKEKMEEYINSIKLGRAGTPEEVANVVLFLLSDLSSYVTGQVIGVDGGMLI